MTRMIGAFAWISLLTNSLPAVAADWNQWRGPGRDGLAAEGPPLISALPDTGVKPVWLVSQDIAAARDGGWSSPVVAGGMSEWRSSCRGEAFPIQSWWNSRARRT